jgi:hypothetical protein
MLTSNNAYELVLKTPRIMFVNAALGLLAVTLTASGCGNKNATPAGTKVLDWSIANSDRAAIKTATIDARKTSDRVETFTLGNEDVKLKIHVESGTAKYEEGGKPMQLASVTAVTASLEDGKDYTFSAGTCRGPDDATLKPGTAPGDALLDCLIHADKPRYQMLVTFTMKGDGTLLPQNAGTTLMVK